MDTTETEKSFYCNFRVFTVSFWSIEIPEKLFGGFDNVFHVSLMRGFQKCERNWILMINQFKSATLLSATHECTPKIWANRERHSFQNWRVQIERHSFLGVSEVKECTLWKSLRIYKKFSHLLNFFLRYAQNET